MISDHNLSERSKSQDIFEQLCQRRVWFSCLMSRGTKKTEVQLIVILAKNALYLWKMRIKHHHLRLTFLVSHSWAWTVMFNFGLPTGLLPSATSSIALLSMLFSFLRFS